MSAIVALTLSCADRVVIETGPNALDPSGTSAEPVDGSTGLGAVIVADSEVATDPSTGREPGSLADDGSDLGSTSAPTCERIPIELHARAPDVLLLQDQSFSMVRPLVDTTTRWDAVYEALFDPSHGVVNVHDGELRFGLTLYTTSFERGSPGPPEECPRLRSPEPWFAPVADLAALYASSTPLGHTPTGAALEAVVERLVQAPSDRERVMILTTDGEPDTCADGFVDNGQEPAVAATRAAFSRGIRVYVVSVAQGVPEAHLQDLANAGVGKPADDPDPAPYYVAQTVDELIQAYTEILETLTRCEFDLVGTVDQDRRCEGLVAIDGTPRACDIDWSVVDGSRLVLLGATCDDARAARPEIVASWPCPP